MDEVSVGSIVATLRVDTEGVPEAQSAVQKIAGGAAVIETGFSRAVNALRTFGASGSAILQNIREVSGNSAAALNADAKALEAQYAAQSKSVSELEKAFQKQTAVVAPLYAQYQTLKETMGHLDISGAELVRRFEEEDSKLEALGATLREAAALKEQYAAAVQQAKDASQQAAQAEAEAAQQAKQHTAQLRTGADVTANGIRILGGVLGGSAGQTAQMAS